jgi:hypothetical protein
LTPDWAAAALASIAPAQVGILQIQIVEGEGGVYAFGARATRPLTVAVTDETGRPVSGAAVSFHLPEDGRSGTFANGLRTEVVTANEKGCAVLRSMQLNRVPGRFQVRIIASKEQATAGTVSFPYIADRASGAAMARGWQQEGRRASCRFRRIAPAQKVDTHPGCGGRRRGAALLARRSGGAVAASGTSTNNPAPIPTTVGAPSIAVGRP